MGSQPTRKQNEFQPGKDEGKALIDRLVPLVHLLACLQAAEEVDRPDRLEGDPV